jgi:MSHA pilin protein MshD
MGFTLIEVIIFIVVVGAGILQVINTTVAKSADPVVAKQALTLADSILAEVMQKDYTGTGGTTRDTFVSIGDYNGATKATFSDWPSALAAYQVAVTVGAEALYGGSTKVNAKRITVTVSRGTDVSVTLSSYRSNY